MGERFLQTPSLSAATPCVANDIVPAHIVGGGCYDLSDSFHFCAGERGWRLALRRGMHFTEFCQKCDRNLIFAISDSTRSHNSGIEGCEIETGGTLACMSNDTKVLRRETTRLHGHVVQTGLVDFGKDERRDVPPAEHAPRSLVSNVDDSCWCFSVKTVSDFVTADQIWSLHMVSLNNIGLDE